jgi:hypothetical protein
MTTAQAVGAVSGEAAEWYAINWQAIQLSSSAFDSWTFFSASRMDTARMKSSKPGAEKRNATLMASLPMWVTEIDASAGMKTVAPACTSLTESLPPIRILKF